LENGIANNVEILTVRAVQTEMSMIKILHLVFVMQLIMAQVINGSFGKNFSPHKEWVYDAIKYAEKKDVLIVHAAK
jgi:hypothetical protein